MKKYVDGKYLDLSEEEIKAIEQEKDEYIQNSILEETENDSANTITETISGKTIIIKEVPPVTEKMVVKATGATAETKLIVVGQNVWDEEWGLTNGGITVASKNYIPVVPGMDYYFYCSSPLFSVEEYETDLFYKITYYDSSKQRLSGKNSTSVSRNRKITIPENCYYMKFELHEAYGIKYLNDICISVDNEKLNGTYASYNKKEYIFNSYGNIVLTAPFDLNMTLFTEDEAVTLECEYKKDIKGAIADSVADVLANTVIDSKDNWELISIGELTEEVSLVALSGFSCSKIALNVNVKGSATNSVDDSLLFRTNKNTNLGGGKNVLLTGTFGKEENQTVELHIPLEMKNKWITGQLISSAGDNFNYSNTNGYDSITAVYLQPVTEGVVFGVGSSYELWGVRA